MMQKVCIILAICHVALAKKMNVLFLVSDDMRPQINSYVGQDFPSPVHPKMHTPNIDKLASRSLLLKRAYVQQALCSPSRTSLLTGRRPDTTHVYDIGPYFRDVGGNYTTLPEYFKDNGYLTIGMGKIFHPGKASGHDDPISWSVPYYHSPNFNYWDTKNVSWLAVPDDQRKAKPLPDDQIKDNAIKVLKQLAEKGKTGEQPFFLAVGFHKPHLPFVFPEEFFNFYPKENISLPPNAYAPVDMPEPAWNYYGGLRGYHDIRELHASGNPNTTLPDKVVKELRRAYYSALSYTDSLMGEVIAEVTNLGLDDSTIISFWGDHGWQLGEHGEWCKQTNFDLATHAPMMVHVPGLTDQGIVTEQLTEFVDLFPTLVEAAGLPQLPLCPEDPFKIKLCREGSSFVPLMKNPNSSDWKESAFSQYLRKENSIMGYSVTSHGYRYTEWVKFEGEPKYKPLWDKIHGIELYDHIKDPEENNNVYKDEKYSRVRDAMHKILHKGWRDALPANENPKTSSGYEDMFIVKYDTKENEIL